MTLSRYIRLLEIKRKQNNNLRFNSSWKKKVQQNAVFEEKYPLVILVIFFVIFIFLVYFLPDNLLIIYPGLRQYVGFMASLFPSVNGYMKYSTFPQIAAFIFATGIILCIPATIYISLCPLNKLPNTTLHEIKSLILNLIGTAFITYMCFYVFPNTPGSPTGSRGKMLSHTLDSRVIFCAINAAILSLNSLLFATIYLRTRRLLNYFYQLMRK